MIRVRHAERFRRGHTMVSGGRRAALCQKAGSRSMLLHAAPRHDLSVSLEALLLFKKAQARHPQPSMLVTRPAPPFTKT